MDDKFIKHGPVARSVPYDPNNDPDCDLTSENVSRSN